MQIRRAATFSPDNTKRYLLARWWYAAASESTESVHFIMLNPSIADARMDDPTVRKCMGFATRWRFNRLVITNLVPDITSRPSALPYWSGTEKFNLDRIRDSMSTCKITVCAWGNMTPFLRDYVAIPEYVRVVREIAFDTRTDLYRIGTTAKGYPLHPSRCAYTLAPEKWLDWRDLRGS